MQGSNGRFSTKTPSYTVYGVHRNAFAPFARHIFVKLVLTFARYKHYNEPVNYIVGAHAFTQNSVKEWEMDQTICRPIAYRQSTRFYAALPVCAAFFV